MEKNAFFLKNTKMILTSIVNLPVSSSARNGSVFGSILSKSSSRRINSCCSNSATARCTSSFRASTNFSAVDGEIVLRSIFLFTISINSLTACQRITPRRKRERKKRENNEILVWGNKNDSKSLRKIKITRNKKTMKWFEFGTNTRFFFNIQV